MTYCKPEDHTWVELVGGKGYDPNWYTTVCITCHCHNGVRKPKREARKPSPLTMIGRL